MTSSAKSISNCIEPSSVASKAVELVDEQDESTLKEACRLHRFCFEEIAYKRHEEIRPALEVLESGGGDCMDQTILLASLLLSRGIPVRTVHVQDHMFPEALLPAEPCEELDRGIRKLYRLKADTEVRALGDPAQHDDVDAAGYWYPVDPEMSRYLGDLQVHVEEKLLTAENGDWQFQDVKLCKTYKAEDFGFQNKVEAEQENYGRIS